MSIQTVFECLEEVSQTSGRNAKIDLIDSLLAEDKVYLKQIVLYTYNPMWSYRITQKEDTIPNNSIPTDELWLELRLVLDQLSKREIELSGGKQKIATLLARSPARWTKRFASIINRDLKVGIQTWDRWFPGLIPAEPMMLCDKYEGQVLNGWIAEPKLDGRRAVIIVDSEGNCTSISRGHKECYNWKHIAEAIKARGIQNVVLDGEFYAGNFSLTQSICSTQSKHPDSFKLKYWVFDMLTIQEWESRKSCILSSRKSFLQRSLRSVPTYLSESALVRVPSFPVDTTRIQEMANTYYTQGFEGIVVKDLSSEYVWDRSDKWLKIKPENEADLTIIGAELGDKGDRHENTLGRFLVEGNVTYKKKQYRIQAKVGGGLKDLERAFFWQLHQQGDLAGLVIEVRYQDVTSTVVNGNIQYSIRFPRFLRVRYDKTPLEKGGK